MKTYGNFTNKNGRAKIVRSDIRRRKVNVSNMAQVLNDNGSTCMRKASLFFLPVSVSTEYRGRTKTFTPFKFRAWVLPNGHIELKNYPVSVSSAIMRAFRENETDLIHIFDASLPRN